MGSIFKSTPFFLIVLWLSIYTKSVGFLYIRWRVEIANGLAKTQNEIHYTNAIAESLNNQLKTIIKVAYGYKNFERFRKKALLIIN